MKSGSSPYRAVVAAALVGLVATTIVVEVTQVRFAYRNPELRLVLETTEGFIALLTAYLIWGRFTRSRSESELVLVFGLALLGISSLAFAVIPNLFDVGPRDVLRTWAPVSTRFVGGIAFALGGLLPDRKVPDTRRALHALAGAVGGTFIVVVLVTQLSDAALPPVIESQLTAEASTRPDLTANPAFTIIQATLFLPYAIASFGFLRRYRATGDDLMRWFAAGTILSAFARVQYALYPSLYSDFFYSGDILRLGFYLFLLVGAVREMRAHWEHLAAARALEERRQLAQDLHDGIAQEMTFLAGQVARLERGGNDPEIVQHIAGATDRAVAETRRAISALRDEIRQPLDVAIRETVLQVFVDDDPKLEMSLAPGIHVPPRRRERIIRIVREAVTNAARHAGAAAVTVTLVDEDGDIVVRVDDDGRGFDPLGAHSGFGLISMKERLQNLGGGFSIRSAPGEGTTVEMRFP